MNITTLKAKVQPGNGVYTLSTATALSELESPTISWLIATYLNGSLTIDPAGITSSDSDPFVTLTGNATVLGVTQTVSAQFEIIDSIAQLKLTTTPLTLDAAWDYTKSFSALANSDIATFGWNVATFTFASSASTFNGDNDTATAGLYFYGEIPSLPTGDSDVWAALSWLLIASNTAPVLEGTIQFEQGEPLFDLTFSNLALSHTFSDALAITLDLSIHYLSAVRTFTDTDGNDSYSLSAYTQIASTVSYTDSNDQTVTLPITTELGEQYIPPVLDFKMDTAETFNALLSSFAGWIGVDLTAYSSTDAFLPAGLTLQAVNIGLGRKRQKIELIALHLGSTSSWDIIPGIFTLENITIDTTVFDPVSSDRDVLSQLRGTLTFAGIDIDLYAQYPDFYIVGGLSQSDNDDISVDMPDVSALLEEQLAADSHAGLESTLIDSLSFLAYPAQQSYELSVVLDGNWDLLSLDISSVALLLNYEEGSLTASASAYFTLSDALAFTLSATYAQSQWLFSGSTTPDSSIAIYDSSTQTGLLADLATLFGTDLSLPAAIDGISISSLAVAFETKTKDFRFSGELAFTINNTAFDLVTHVDIQRQQDDTFAKNFAGSLTVGDLEFDALFDETGDSNLLIASYADTNGSEISLATLLADIFDSATIPIPDVLSFTLHDATLVHDSSNSKNLFIADVDSGLNLGNLPLVGELLADDETIELSYQILIASDDFTTAEIERINGLLPDSIASLASSETVTAGIHLATTIKFGQETVDFSLPLTTNNDTDQTPTNNQPVQVDSGATTTASDNTHWYNLQKTFGPVHFGRIGVDYDGDANEVWFRFDASLSFAGFTLELTGLSLGSPLTTFDPEFDLQGLGVDYSNSALQVGGAFLRSEVLDADTGEKLYDEYSGLARLSLESLNLYIGALGSYAYIDGHPSLFIYAILDYPLGGPSFFFVEGLAAGFGYNRRFSAPAIDKVADFPLITEAMQGGGSLDGVDLSQELAQLNQYIYPSTGDLFLAIGVKFNSFKQVDSFALIAASFGNRFELDLLGLSHLAIPYGATQPLAEIEMAIKASFVPDEGFLGIEAQLTNNAYILSKDCHLTGGFAFYSWFSGDYAGDFVASLGGYHPRFNVPAHYPQVPRLGFNWKVDSHLTIKGEAYFALCAHALMAGGYIEGTYESGAFKADFKEGADFILGWKPFHYEGDIYVHLSASYTYHFFGTHHISADLSADLNLWGPEFGGKGRVKIWVVHINITFGDQNRQVESILWDEFDSAFLPPESKRVSLQIQDGVVSPGSTSDYLGVINPKTLALATSSVIPIKSAIANPSSANPADLATTTTGGQAATTDLGISAMGLTALVKAGHIITLAIDGQPFDDIRQVFQFEPILKKVPTALWGTQSSVDDNGKPNVDTNGTRFIDHALVGYTITPAQTPTADHTRPMQRSFFQYQTTAVNEVFDWSAASTATSTGFDDASAYATVQNTITDTQTTADRDTLLSALGLGDLTVDLDDATADQFLWAA